MRENIAKQAHIRDVLRALMRAPGSTKPELCRACRLPASTVHYLVEELVTNGLALQSGLAESSGGRRAARYQLNGELGLLAAASIRSDRFEVGVYDLDGARLATDMRHVACASLGPESYTAELADALAKALRQLDARRLRCLGVGVTVPGAVDESAGCVMQLSCAPMWQQFPLADRLSDALRAPVAVDKDVYAVLQYLEWWGRMRRSRCAVYLAIDDGIRSAVMINGRVFRGVHGVAGEIGHLTARRDGIPCGCGNTGCLELYCSDAGIVNQYNAQAGAGFTRVEDVLLLMNEGDEAAARVMSQATRYLVDAISTLIMSHDPEELLIYCGWLNKERGLFYKMLDALYHKGGYMRRHAVDIRLLEADSPDMDAAFTLAQTKLLVDHCAEQLRIQA